VFLSWRYPWSLYNGGSNSVQAYLAAFRHMATVIRNTGANVSIQQAYNSMNVGGSDSMQSMYVGDQYCDEVTVSAYNFACLTGGQSQGIDQILKPWYEVMLQTNSKRLGVSEMSSTGQCGVDKPQWIADTWYKLALDFPRIQTINFFFVNKGREDLDLNDGAQLAAFSAGWYNWHALTQSWQQGDLPMFNATDAQKQLLDQATQDYKDGLVANNIVHPEVIKRTPNAPPLSAADTAHENTAAMTVDTAVQAAQAAATQESVAGAVNPINDGSPLLQLSPSP
jgi:hypothetical protein